MMTKPPRVGGFCMGELWTDEVVPDHGKMESSPSSK